MRPQGESQAEHYCLVAPQRAEKQKPHLRDKRGGPREETGSPTHRIGSWHSLVSNPAACLVGTVTGQQW